jgi:hypothetical protein
MQKGVVFNSVLLYNICMMIEKGNEMLKNSTLAVVGNVIRGYDFKPMVGREDCFVEGVVEQITNETGYMAYKITCTKDVFDGEKQPKGKYSRVGKIIYIPMEVSFMEYDGRVMNLSK